MYIVQYHTYDYILHNIMLINVYVLFAIYYRYPPFYDERSQAALFRKIKLVYVVYVYVCSV